MYTIYPSFIFQEILYMLIFHVYIYNYDESLLEVANDTG